MDITTFLEALANQLHYKFESMDLINKQPEKIKMAFLHNDGKELQEYFPNVGYLATPSDVVRI